VFCMCHSIISVFFSLSLIWSCDQVRQEGHAPNFLTSLPSNKSEILGGAHLTETHLNTNTQTHTPKQGNTDFPDNTLTHTQKGKHIFPRKTNAQTKRHTKQSHKHTRTHTHTHTHTHIPQTVTL